MMTVNPYLSFKGTAREAIEFYKTVLEAQVLFVQTVGESPMPDCGPAENIMHCTLQIGDSTIMLSDDPNPQSTTAAGNISLAISLDQVDKAKKVFENLSKNGTVAMPLEKTFWADAFGMVTDQFGILWAINCESKK